MSDEELLNKIMDFEEGDISYEEYLKLFSYLVSSGKAWTLQGMYGRIATGLIESGSLGENGDILEEIESY